MAKRAVGALPIIGLISRLTATEGGIGNDAQAYPEFCRQVFDAAPQGFQIAVAELQDRHGKAAQRKYVLLALWMARHGGGIVPGKAIVDSARRVRVSSDLEFEMDRFSEALNEINSKYTYMERPRGSLAQQADIAVDALARLVLALKDGAPIAAEDAPLIEEAACGGFWDVPGIRDEVQRSIQEREARATAYV
ncbi:calcium homeostasis regulater C 1 [Micractinium conductrix]|uniref:Calcium homeostasis regulater C 1 n=1 Tax=Micractinium conductrix TaxID=554055 RepID=A0A2P6VSD2_9CHLO|nr:calcium homeostasis regulater C 1 [Micractinium conductrix]|eukprot:PSC77003.1 calcium homeostasis regulater C 1 [Micractinium conductrix]